MNLTNLLTYQELLAKCAKSGSSLVPPLTVGKKKIAIVGEALGKDELFMWNQNKDKRPRPDCYFVGSAGQLLDKLLGEVGLPRTRCHITNVIKVRPPENKIDKLKDLDLTVQDFYPLLKEELLEVNPDIIIPLGNVALEAVSGIKGITKWRGSEIESTIIPSKRVFPTLHPSYIQRGQWSLYPFVRNDLKTAASASLGLEVARSQWTGHLDPTLDEVLDYIEECKNAESTVLDIETA